MATFPAIVADHPVTEEVKVRERRAQLGDGAEYITRFGLNPVDTTWRLKWTRLSDAERTTVEAFLAARAADGEPFDWTPPDAATAQRFRVDQWEPARTTPTGWALDLVFRRVFEVGGPITGIPTITCSADLLAAPCSIELNARGGFMWVQQFLSGVYRPNSSYDPWPSSVISPDGSLIYMAFYYYPIAESTSTGYLLVACFDYNGNHQWTKQIVETQNTAGTNSWIHMAATPSGVAVALVLSSGNHRFIFFTSAGTLSWAKVYALGDSLRFIRYAPISDCLYVASAALSLGTQLNFARINPSTGALITGGRLTVGAGWERMDDMAELADGSFVAVGIFGTILRVSADWTTRLNLVTLTRSGSPVDVRRVAKAGNDFIVHTDQALFKLTTSLSLVWRSAGTSLGRGQGVIGLEVDANGVIYHAVANTLPFTTSGVSYLGNFFSGTMAAIAGDGSAALSGSASQSLFDSSATYVTANSRSARTQNPERNQFVTAYNTGIGLISHSISLPLAETRLTLSGGVDQARYIGDCSPPTIAIDNSGITFPTLSWTWSNPSITVTNLTLTTLDLTSSVTWTKASRTL